MFTTKSSWGQSLRMVLKAHYAHQRKSILQCSPGSPMTVYAKGCPFRSVQTALTAQQARQAGIATNHNHNDQAK